MNLGERYKDLRLSVKDESGQSISIKEFAANCVNLQAPRISELENNKREMSLTELKAYHEYFKVSFEYLLGETDVKTASTDIQTASIVTGLSEEAVELLKRLRESQLGTEEEKERGQSVHDTINKFLSSNECVLIFHSAVTAAKDVDSLYFNGILNKADQVEALRLWLIHDTLKKVAEIIVNNMCGGADNGKH